MHIIMEQTQDLQSTVMHNVASKLEVSIALAVVWITPTELISFSYNDGKLTSQ